MTHHGCKLSVEGLCVVVRLVEVSISPLDEVPGLDPKVLGAGVDSLHFAVGEVCRMNVRFRGVTDVESPVEATRTLVFPQDTSPSLTAVLGRFSILSVAKSLQDKVDAAGCSSPDEIGLLRRRKTVSTLHIVGSCRRGVGIEFGYSVIFIPYLRNPNEIWQCDGI